MFYICDDKRQSSRYELVTAGHHFLITALPPDRPTSQATLETFAATIRRIRVLPTDLELVLLRCLAVVNRYCAERIPSVVDQYLALAPTNCVSRFVVCVDDFLRF